MTNGSTDSPGSGNRLSDAKRALLDQWLTGRGGILASEPKRRPPDASDIPLSFAQERMWFLHQLDPESPRVQRSHTIWLRAAIDEQALEQSINGIVCRHEVLRTHFALRGDQPVQVIEPMAHIPLSVHDLRQLIRTSQADELERLVWKETRRPFDLARGLCCGLPWRVWMAIRRCSCSSPITSPRMAGPWRFSTASSRSSTDGMLKAYLLHWRSFRSNTLTMPSGSAPG